LKRNKPIDKGDSHIQSRDAQRVFFVKEMDPGTQGGWDAQWFELIIKGGEP